MVPYNTKNAPRAYATRFNVEKSDGKRVNSSSTVEYIVHTNHGSVKWLSTHWILVENYVVQQSHQDVQVHAEDKDVTWGHIGHTTVFCYCPAHVTCNPILCAGKLH